MSNGDQRFNLKDYFTAIPRGSTGQLYDWCEENGFIRPTDCVPSARYQAIMEQTDGVEAFTLWTGGVIHIPLDRLDEALALYARDVESGLKLFYNQVCSTESGTGARLILDIDSSDRRITDDEIDIMGEVLVRVLKMYYSDYDENPVEVYSAKSDRRLKGNCDVESTAVHFVVPLRVSYVEACQITYGFGLEMKKSRMSMDKIEVDAGVYKKSGRCNLRMPYSSKVDDCPVCKKVMAKKISCDFCERTGSMMSTKTYEPWMVYGADGKTSTEFTRSKNTTFVQMIHNYSIWARSDEERTDYVRPDAHPVIPVNDVKKRPYTVKAGKANKFRAINVNPALEKAIRKFMHNGHRPWEDTDIESVDVRSTGSGVAFVYLDGIGSSNCPYKGDGEDHGGNRGYFKINRARAEADFFCRSTKYQCQEKERISFPISREIVNDMFGIANPPTSAVRYNPANANLKRKDRRPSLLKRQENQAKRRKQNRLNAINQGFNLGIQGFGQ